MAFSFYVEKLANSDSEHFFEDGIKMKIPSEIKQPLKHIEEEGDDDLNLYSATKISYDFSDFDGSRLINLTLISNLIKMKKLLREPKIKAPMYVY